MSLTVAKPATTPIPVQLSETECSRLSYHTSRCPSVGRSAHWAITTSVTSSCGSCRRACHGSAYPYRRTPRASGHSLPTIPKVFATWADDGSLWRAFVARVRHLAAEKHLDLRILHGDGTNTVTKKGVIELGTRGTKSEGRDGHCYHRYS